jgi:small GTP-binding protein
MFGVHQRMAMAMRTQRSVSFSSPFRQFSSAPSAPPTMARLGEAPDPSAFPPELVRNFSIIAHIDHGKSTLSDRLLEVTGTIVAGSGQPQVLDKLQVERERGITVKANTASMQWTHTDGKRYLLNLIDTPGHVDFHYEVSRSLAACQGALLVVDAVKGVQAQTVANFRTAHDMGLKIIPVINKIDLPHADVDRITKQLVSVLNFKPEE